MDKNGYVVLIAGVGYLGYNLAYNYIQEGNKVLIITRKNSIHRRPVIFQKLRELGVKFVMDYELTPGLVKKTIEKIRLPKIIYYLAGVNRGNKREMKYVHGELSYRIASKIYKEIRYRGRYIHISAYNPGKVVSAYIESKIYGEELMMKLLRKGYSITILRPGLLVGKYPYHPEWRQLYQLARKGIVLETSLITGYTPIKDLYGFVNYLEEKDIYLDKPMDLTIYSYDIGLISKVFVEQMGYTNPLVLRVRHPKSLWRVLPYGGSLGFIRGFLYPHKPPLPEDLYRTGYRPKTNLIQEMRISLKTMETFKQIT